jgi:hypothetical protein
MPISESELKIFRDTENEEGISAIPLLAILVIISSQTHSAA